MKLNNFLMLILVGLFLSCQTKIENDSLLPHGSDELIEKALSRPVIELVTGDTGYAISGNYKIWYNSINPGKGKETVLLLSGLGTSSLEWPQWLLDELVSNGYNILRFDYRDVGMSDWATDWTENSPYSLEDLGRDAVAVLEANSIDSTHLLGHSMGGMVAQSISINYPDRVKSVTSISSTGYMTNPEISQEPMNNFLSFISEVHATFSDQSIEKNSLNIRLATINYFKGTRKRYSENDALEYLNYDLYQRNSSKSSNPDAGRNQFTAVWISGSRLDALKKIDTPYLAIHGKADNFIIFEHAKLYSEIIKNCKTLWVKDMGHGMSVLDSKKILGKVIPFLKKHS